MAAWIRILQLWQHGYASPATAAWICVPSYGCKDRHPPATTAAWICIPSYGSMDRNLPATAALIGILQLRLHGYASSSYGRMDKNPTATAAWICVPSYGCMDMRPQLRLQGYASPATAAWIGILHLRLQG